MVLYDLRSAAHAHLSLLISGVRFNRGKTHWNGTEPEQATAHGVHRNKERPWAKDERGVVLSAFFVIDPRNMGVLCNQGRPYGKRNN